MQSWTKQSPNKSVAQEGANSSQLLSKRSLVPINQRASLGSASEEGQRALQTCDTTATTDSRCVWEQMATSFTFIAMQLQAHRSHRALSELDFGKLGGWGLKKLHRETAA